MSKYGTTVIFPKDYAIVVENTIEALREQGFGVITEIDVKATLKIKINEDFERYIILGACNPVLSKQALEIEREIGLFLPVTSLYMRLRKETQQKS
ncbi:MAG: DUF302 domain-containing protein [Candidatus Hodarchaeales archaeon]|jgi:uncharacterized protein (DUF302 family)